MGYKPTPTAREAGLEIGYRYPREGARRVLECGLVRRLVRRRAHGEEEVNSVKVLSHDDRHVLYFILRVYAEHRVSDE